MGTIFLSSCECGFEKTLMIGRGMRDDDSVSMAPALCKNCRDIKMVNIHSKDRKCFGCDGDLRVYDDPSKVLENPSQPHGGGELYIVHASEPTEGENADFDHIGYLCPACGKFEMIFKLVGNWD
jgi:hypothetical protein